MYRVLAGCGWLTWRLRRFFERTPLRRLGSGRMVAVVIAVLLVGALAPLVTGFVQPQPQDVTVEEIVGGLVTHPDRWVRVHGRAVPLQEPPAPEPGEYGLLVDAVDTLRAIVLRSTSAITPADETVLTGHLVPATIDVEPLREDLPQIDIDATVFGTPPDIIPDRVVELDAAPEPARVVLWPISIVLALVAAVIAVGLRAGYPIFRTAREVDVLARPLGPGERIPAAVGGRVGEDQFDLGDPAEALLITGRGARGSILMVQLLTAGGPAPPPVPIGGGWSSGRIGYVHTLNETIPALAVRAERAEAVILFARRGERDRAAAMVGVER